MTTLIVIVIPTNLFAATIVFGNRTPNKVVFQIKEKDQDVAPQNLPSGDVLAWPVKQGGTVTYTTDDGPKEKPLKINSAYCFITDSKGQLAFGEISLVAGDDKGSARPTTPATTAATTPAPPELIGPWPFDSDDPRKAGTPLPATEKAGAKPEQKKLLVIPVKILVDDDEKAPKNVWKGRLSRRIQAANDILEKTCRAKFEIIGYEEWVSDNRISDFTKSLAEFEQKVKPEQARVAIGFTSQYEVPTGQFHLGGTRGPLHTHILIREWSQHINEPERLEVLLHELGHFLGSVHSPAPDSVMRAMLGDRQARAKDFRVGFDPVNTLAMSMVSEDLRARPVRSFQELSSETQLRLNDIYYSIGKATPNDPTPDQYRGMLKLPK